MQPPVNSLHYAIGPLTALLVVALLAVFLRWALGRKPSRDPWAPPPDPSGLLEVVATLPSPEQARALRAVLSDADIRSTSRARAGGGVTDVLVFAEDAVRARRLAGPNAGGG